MKLLKNPTDTKRVQFPRFFINRDGKLEKVSPLKEEVNALKLRINTVFLYILIYFLNIMAMQSDQFEPKRTHLCFRKVHN